MAVTKTLPFDPATYLADPADQAELLSDALATGDASYIAHALGTIARARGLSSVARGAGVTREALYKSLTRGGDPKLTTVMGLLRTMNIRLVATSAPAERARRVARAKPGRSRRAA